MRATGTRSGCSDQRSEDAAEVQQRHGTERGYVADGLFAVPVRSRDSNAASVDPQLVHRQIVRSNLDRHESGRMGVRQIS